jgi:RimJ/RimL family protein N-acetyltransferase
MAGVAPVETARLVLRCVEQRDEEAFTTLMTPGISRWVGAWPVPFTAALAASKVADTRKAAEAGQLLPFVITNRTDGTAMGWVAIGRTGEKPERGVLSYWLGEAFQRQGVLREAGEAAVQAAFDRFGLAAIEATTRPDNAGSIGTLRSLGFHPYTEGMVWAEARQAHEFCLFFERHREREP